MEAPEIATQLADSRPQYDIALRVAIPVNAPQRNQKSSRDSLIRTNAFSSSSYTISRQLINASKSELISESKMIINNDIDKILKSQLSVGFNLENDSNVKTLIKVYNIYICIYLYNYIYIIINTYTYI